MILGAKDIGRPVLNEFELEGTISLNPVVFDHGVLSGWY